MGLQDHELPSGGMVLSENMVMTFEPPVYLPNWGGVRIDDDAFITTTGATRLTSTTRELVI